MKILSIDFDIIMKPCINLYNDDIDSFTDCYELWRRKLPELRDKLDFDSNILTDITVLLKSQKCPITFIGGHEEIVKFITEKSDIVNVDFHHDIYYGRRATEVNYTCANWVEHLFLKGLLNSYTWYGTDISKDFKDETEIPFTKKDVSEIGELGNDFDKAIVCFSPHWIPPIFYPVWKNLIQNVNGAVL